MKKFINIPLSSEKYLGLFAQVDEEDFSKVAGIRWTPLKLDRLTYALARQDGRTIYMHRLVLGLTSDDGPVDHRNHNGLDNRRENLRVRDHRSNMLNSRPRRNTASAYKGVSRKGLKWRARIKVHGVESHLGTHETEEAAALAYDRAARKHFGEYAYLNFPDTK